MTALPSSLDSVRVFRTWRYGSTRDGMATTEFQDRCLQPLGHPSGRLTLFGSAVLPTSAVTTAWLPNRCQVRLFMATRNAPSTRAAQAGPLLHDVRRKNMNHGYGPADLKAPCSTEARELRRPRDNWSQLLGCLLLSRIVGGIDEINAAWPGEVNLEDYFFVGGPHIMRMLAR
jgi:hypothetical protein